MEIITKNPYTAFSIKQHIISKNQLVVYAKFCHNQDSFITQTNFMLTFFLNLSSSKFYWLALLLLSITFEAVALSYQYILDYYPCVLCIHTRILVLAMFFISLLGISLYKKKYPLVALHILMAAICAGLLERSYQLIGVERGFIAGSCSMSSGLPNWFALDKWFPLFFEVQEPCGYTPELLFGITMAEALVVLSILLVAVSVTFAIKHIKLEVS